MYGRNRMNACGEEEAEQDARGRQDRISFSMRAFRAEKRSARVG
jgi:hypothetical protein